MSDEVLDLTEDAVEDVPQVAASEHDLITMARALVSGPTGEGDIWALLCSTRQLPPKIGARCAALLEETLRHAWRALWLRGGARPTASLGPAGAVVRGRLWERHAPVPLAFSAASIRLLRWLVATPFAAPVSTLPELPAMPLALGDQVLIYLALDAARATPALRGIAAQPCVRAAPLAWLGAAPLLVAPDVEVPAFDSLTEGAGALVIEALAAELAQRWTRAELAKRAVTDPAELIALGEVQDAVLARFMAACDARGRRDLATFVIDAAAPLFARDLSPAPAELDPRAPLAQRAQARTAAGSLLRAVLRWHDWDQQHRGIRFIDDGYATAQLLLARFESIGPAGAGKAGAWLADLAALAPLAPSAPPSSAIIAEGSP